MLLIREAAAEDVPALLAVYAPYVRGTAVTFEYEVPGEAEFAGRLRRGQARWPWLAAERDGEILGYACLSAFHPRAAYQWCAETTIYLRQDCRGRGLGRLLLGALEDAARAMGLLSLYACIAVPPEEDDPHLTGASAAFHRRMGYRLRARFPRCGYKFGTWYDMIWMEKTLAERPPCPAPPVPFPLLAEKSAGSGRIPRLPVEMDEPDGVSPEAPREGGYAMDKYECPCSYVYDPEVGDPEGGIAPGTAFEDIPEDWVCPVCGLGKDAFTKVE